MGRFREEDIYRGDGLSLYVYCGNNPSRYIDPSGYSGEELGVDISIFKKDSGGNPIIPSKDCIWNKWEQALDYKELKKLGMSANEAYYLYTGKEQNFDPRATYMGGTPQKKSTTGKQVIQRMYTENPTAFDFGKLKQDQADEYKRMLREGIFATGKVGEDFFKKIKYNGERLKDYDMGHTKDAVTEWNSFFRNLGREEGIELAKMWMKDADIYILEYKRGEGGNRSKGGALGHQEGGQYKAPVSDAEVIQRFREAHQEEIDKIREKYKCRKQK